MGKAVVVIVNFLFKLLDSGINTVNLNNRKKCENYTLKHKFVTGGIRRKMCKQV